MNIDVFLCRHGDDPIRQAMFQLVMERWAQEPGAQIHPLFGNSAHFQYYRRRLADMAATTPIYVVADDDCLPQRKPFLQQAVETFYDTASSFGILSLIPANCHIRHWTPDFGYQTVVNDDIMEHVSVGGVRFIQKGIQDEDWPIYKGHGYDMDHSVWLRSRGYRVGYFRKFTMNHIGEGYSTVWPSH